MARKKKETVLQSIAVPPPEYPHPGYVMVTKETDPDVSFDSIKRDLTFKSREIKTFSFGKQNIVTLFEEIGDILFVPKTYAKEHRIKGHWQVSDGVSVDLGFDEVLQSSRPETKKIQDDLISLFLTNYGNSSQNHRGGMLCAPCAAGKTVMSLKLADILGKTTLVMVHKEFLVKQWIERIEQFLDIPKDKIGRIQGKKCQFEGKSIVIGMIQSLAMRQYTPEVYSYFGTILVDEAHRISAPMFSQALPKFSARNVVGVTATPRRGDGLEQVFGTLIGPVISKTSAEHKVIPTIYQIGFSSYCPEKRYVKRNERGHIKKIFMATLINLLSENKRRSEYIVKEMVKALQKGRRVLVFSDRLDHLKDMKDGLDQAMSNVTTGYYVGGMKPEEWEKSSQCDAIFSTYAMGKEGLDIPAMDTLFLATPKGDVEQAVGRVVRECMGKKDPIVVDIVDQNEVCEGFAQKRRFQYQRLGYKVKQL